MPDILIRDVPSEVADALTELSERGLLGWIAKSGYAPISPSLFSSHRQSELHLAVFGPQDEVYGSIRRSPDGKVSFQLRPVPNLSPEQRLAVRQAGEAVRRNDPGDREKAFKTLGGVLEVYEIPYGLESHRKGEK
jgi:hypothetical protein